MLASFNTHHLTRRTGRRGWTMDTLIDPVAGIEWLAGLFPVRAPRQGSLTVMFTDIAGFTAYAATRGDRAAARLVHRHDAAVLPAIRRHSGRILKRLGDGLMAAFASPAAALRAALEMQQAARAVRRDPGERHRARRGGWPAGALSTRAGARDSRPGAAAALPRARDDHVR